MSSTFNVKEMLIKQTNSCIKKQTIDNVIAINAIVTKLHINKATNWTTKIINETNK